MQKERKRNQKKEKRKPCGGNWSGFHPEPRARIVRPGFQGGTLTCEARFVVFGEPDKRQSTLSKRSELCARETFTSIPGSPKKQETKIGPFAINYTGFEKIVNEQGGFATSFLVTLFLLLQKKKVTGRLQPDEQIGELTPTLLKNKKQKQYTFKPG